MFGKKKPVSTDRLQAALGRREFGPPAPPEIMHGRNERSQREGTWSACRLVWLPSGWADGIILDLSSTGARVRFRGRLTLPQQVRLVSAKLNLDRTAKLVRRDGYDIALHFVD